ncbi:hypothetical protein BX600DRAFT_436632 [Xylariales sp. PMI_506]|nr:hypothetical protein BX600DRAFT_436632 [Xylariales sp. PMI_506]
MPSNDNQSWDIDDDGALCKLKADGQTWSNIARSLNRSKTECKVRYRLVREATEKAGADPNQLGESWASDIRAQGREVPSPEKPSPVKANAATSKHQHDKQDSKGKMVKQKEEARFIQSRDEQAKNKDKSRGRRKKVVVINEAPSFSTLMSSPTTTSSSCYSSEGGGSTDSEEERQEQKRHIYRDIYRALYPATRTYKSDRYWSKDDCEILSAIEAKHEALKWKYIQAEFFNATGRMVASELIKHKLAEADQ